MPASPQSKSSPGLFVRVLRFVLFVGVTIFTLGALALSWFSHQGRKDWEQTKADLLARGEKLSLSEYLPPPLPDEQNFYADPLWAELADVVEVQKEGVSVPEVRLPKGRRQLDGLNHQLSLIDLEALQHNFPGLIPPGEKRGCLELARSVWKNAGREEPATRHRAGEMILALLSYSEPTLSRLEYLSQRSGAWLAESPSQRLDPNTAIWLAEYLSYFLQIGQILQLRAVANLMTERPQEAVRDIRSLQKFAAILGQDPLLISFMVRTSMDQMALAATTFGIQHRLWSENELREMEGSLQNFQAGLLAARALRGERGFFNESLESFSREPFREDSPLKVLGPYFPIFGAGDLAAANRIFQTLIETAEGMETRGIHAEQVPDPATSKRLSHPLWRITHIMTALSLPPLTSHLEKTALLQTQINQTRLAIALERYRLREGVYPETLEALVPHILPELPPDVIMMQPMPYRRIAPDEFVLWSFGWDGKNQGGESEWTWGRVVR